jgi:hypothetical protein
LQVGSLDGQLSRPNGVRLSADGAHVIVTDGENNRVSLFSLATGAFVRHVVPDHFHRLKLPHDVVECEGGYLVANHGALPVVFLPASGGDVTSLGAEGFEEGQFGNPSALELLKESLTLFVREKGNERYQVFSFVEAE